MRRRRAALKALDAFPKVPEDYQKPTARGGTLSILSLSIIAVLVVSEFFYYMSSQLKFKYSVDVDMDAKLLFTLDMTIGMPCQYLGADIIDLAGESKSLSSHMKMEDTVFDLSEEQQIFFNAKRDLLAQFSDSRSLNEFPIVENFNKIRLPKRQETTTNPGKKTSCRIHGSMDVKKVAGNFHVTVGRSIPHPQGHAHLNVFVPKEILNFSHRIDHFSFGPLVPGAINQLDTTLKVTTDRNHVYQYFLQIVPTKFSTFGRSLSTNQYSVTERNRTINHRQGSHGVPGIFFKFDMSAMVVEIMEVRQPFWKFLVRLCGIVGGIFATSGMIHSFIGSLIEGALCKVLRKRDTDSNSTDNHHHNSHTLLSSAHTEESST